MKPTDEQIEKAARWMAQDHAQSGNRSFEAVEHHVANHWKRYANEAEAILTAAGVKPRVKPLDWIDDDWCDIRWTARTMFNGEHDFGQYRIAFKEENAEGEEFVLWLPEGHRGTMHPTLEDAKDTAQADYDARILSALTTEGE